MRMALVSIFILVSTLLYGVAHAFECLPGKYEGKTWSVTKPLNGHSATLDVSEEGGWCSLRFKIPSIGVEELWRIKDNKLEQKEFGESGKEVASYGATLRVRDGLEGYYVDCDGGSCDAGADSRYFWRLTSSGRRVVYSVWGVAPELQSNPKAKPRKRHEYTFTKTK